MPRLCPFISKVIKDHLAKDWDSIPSDFSSWGQTFNFLKLFLATWERWGSELCDTCRRCFSNLPQRPFTWWFFAAKGLGEVVIILWATESAVSLKSEEVPRSGVLEVRALRTLF